MVSIGLTPPRPRASLRSLLETRDASLAVSTPSAAARLGRTAKRARAATMRGLGQTTRTVAATLLTLFSLLLALIVRHGLVLAGLAAWTVAAWSYSTPAGLAAAGAGAFFLELRRR